MKFARLKQYAMSTALALSIIFSFGMSMPSSAMAASSMDTMSHEGTTVSSCMSQHHVAPGAAKETTIDQREDDEPTPEPQPYFVQFQSGYVEQRQATPKDIVRSSSYNPPDIIRLTSNIRF